MARLIGRLSKPPHRVGALVCVLAFIVLILVVAYRFIGLRTEDWSKAPESASRLPVIHVTVAPMDGTNNLWDYRDSHYDTVEMVTARRHWLASLEGNVSIERPARLWKDGKLIATVGARFSYKISEDGQHYMYSGHNSFDFDQPGVRLYVDGQPSYTCDNLEPLGISNDAKIFYYDCSTGDDTRLTVYRNGRAIGTVNTAVPGAGSFWMSADGTQYILDASGYIALLNGRKVDTKGAADIRISPNFSHVLYTTDHPLFLIGDDVDVFVDGHKIATGNIHTVAVDNNGEATYEVSNGSGGGYYVIHGKRYSFGNGKSIGTSYVSPSQTHFAVIVNDALYLDGEALPDRLAAADDYTTLANRPDVQLTDDGLFLYDEVHGTSTLPLKD